MKRWPIIRHYRYFCWKFRFWRWWWEVGQHYGAAPDPGDLKYLEAIWQGRA